VEWECIKEILWILFWLPIACITLNFQWVPGCAGLLSNELAGSLAKAAIFLLKCPVQAP